MIVINYKCSQCGTVLPFSADHDADDLCCPLCDCENLIVIDDDKPADDGMIMIFYF